MSEPKRLTKQEQAVAIVQHAAKHNLLINPGSGYGYALDQIRKFNHCPCDASREHCPCEQSLEEVQRQGHCKCHLYWRDLQTWTDEQLH